MFRTIWSKTLREYRVPILGWGIGLALIVLASFSTYGSVTQSQGSQDSLQQLAQQFRIFGDPIALNTLDGFITWRLFDLILPTMLCIWTLLAGARLVRGEEERGSMDLLLATPNARTRLLLEKLGALMGALLVIGVLIGLGASAGEAQGGSAAHIGNALLAGLNISLFAFFIATLALFLSQLVRNRGTAAGGTGGLLVLFVLLEITGRTTENGGWIRWLSPFSYYTINKPLIASYTGNIEAALVLLGLALVLLVASLLLFAWRDIGGVALAFGGQTKSTQQKDRQRALKRASADISCRAISLRALRAQLVPAFWWLLGLAIYAAWLTSLTPSLLAPLQQIVKASPILSQIFSAQNALTSSGFLNAGVFLIQPVLAVTFALTQALNWSSDLDSGRLELLLSTPIGRTRMQLGCFVAVLVFAILAPLLTWGAIVLGTLAVNLSIDNGKIAAASLEILPLELVIATFVYALAARLRGNTILGLAALYLALAFFSETLHSALNLPDWLMSLSIFHAYGSPALDGWHWEPMVILLGIALVLLGIGIVQFRLADIERGA